MGRRIPRPYYPPGADPTSPGMNPDGTVVDPYPGPTVGDVVDGVRDVIDAMTQEVGMPEVKAEPRAEPQARALDCSETPDETVCNQCALKQGFIGPPLTGRYVNRKNLINYEYQLFIANLNAAPLAFTYLVAPEADPERNWLSVDTLFDYMERGGHSRTVAEWHFNACEFDGFWPSMCTVVEAKGNYQQFVDENGDLKYEFARHSVFEPWRLQMSRQREAIRVAEPEARLEWYFMQQTVLSAAVALKIVDADICRHLPMPGQAK